MNALECVLFDLDGTLADTAPDLAAALNRVRKEEDLPPVAESETRPVTSQGVRGLLRVGFGLEPGNQAYAGMAERVLEHYAAAICEHTRLFEGMERVISVLEGRGTKWGIVTNKHARFTTPLVSALGLDARAACVVSGDTAKRPKPFPDPLLHACTIADSRPQYSAYVGDDLRDIQAGRAASMRTLAAAWGYLGEDASIEAWGADLIVPTPEELLDALDTLALR